jgi:hypothetical protein
MLKWWGYFLYDLDFVVECHYELIYLYDANFVDIPRIFALSNLSSMLIAT